ncbi:2-hydroxyglutaryl-CoA dehydratase [candidate division FCPU426 bacterium]|nr:2-hydroxyglutaryl-CoA dehydratase [candidate division FCPU426 bacterium]
MRLGVDIGSRKVKFALQDQDGRIKLWDMPTPDLYHRFLQDMPGGSNALDFGAMGLLPLHSVAATGYGRNNVKVGNAMVISEILAHVAGAKRFSANAFILLDVGGQDTKVVLVRNQEVEDFAVNDKCAAGSGRYLENMAIVLGVSLEELFRHYQDPEDLSTTCAVYAESEIIGKIAEGVPLPRLCAGVNHSTFLRIRPMLERWPQPNLVFVGGGARNQALVYFLQQAGYRVTVPETPEFNGAYGCLEMLNKERRT